MPVVTNNNSHHASCCNYIFSNQQIINTSEYKNTNIINHNDRGFTLGDGIFETLLSYNYKIPFFDQHWQRLTTGLKYLDINLDKKFNKTYIYNIIQELIRLNLASNSIQNSAQKSALGIKIIITRGQGPRSIEPLPNYNYQPNIVISCFNTKLIYNLINLDFSQKSLLILEHNQYKINQYSELNQIKSLNYLDKILAKQYAIANNYNDALLMNLDNNICEATTSNIFFILEDNSIITPKLADGILPGTTRAFFINQFKKYNIKFCTQSINYQDILNNQINKLKIQYCFITNAIMGFCPIYRINHHCYQASDNISQKLASIFLTHLTQQHQV